MLDQSCVYRIHRLYASNSHSDQLKVLGDTRTPFAVRHLLFGVEYHRSEAVVR